MAEEETEDTATENAATEAPEGDAGEESPKKSKKKLLLIVAVLLLTLCGAGAYFIWMAPGEHSEQAESEEGGEDGEGKAPKMSDKVDPVHYDLPEFLVNLNTNGKGTSYLKTSVTLELKNQDSVANVDKNLPKIVDAVNTYLRELRPSDLAGSAGIYRLREELMLRINRAIYPAEVLDIYFREMIVQ